MLFSNASCTMFLVKEGYKEYEKLEKEHKEKEEQKERQEQQQDSTTPRDHGQWTPSMEE